LYFAEIFYVIVFNTLHTFIDKNYFAIFFMNFNQNTVSVTGNDSIWQSTLETGFLPQKFIINFIKKPVNTQKSLYAMSRNKQYTFDVDPRLTKSQMKKLFEKLFGVNIVQIQTHIPPRKKIRVGNVLGSSQKIKRVIFTLKEGQTLKFDS
jgi:large subunit ribosomal protein L23